MPSVPPTWAEGPCLYCPQGLCQQPSGPRGEHLMDKCMTCLRPPSVELVTFSVTFGDPAHPEPLWGCFPHSSAQCEWKPASTTPWTLQ